MAYQYIYIVSDFVYVSVERSATYCRTLLRALPHTRVVPHTHNVQSPTPVLEVSQGLSQLPIIDKL
jgi:hypothetical protein